MERLYNPFEKIAGWQALLWGWLGILIAATLAALNGAHFTGLFSAVYTISTGWYVPFFELMLIWFPLTVYCALYCHFIGSSHYRLIDVIGTVSFSMIPYILIGIGGFVRSIPIGNEIQYIMAIIVIFVALTWSLALIFHSLRISGNLKQKRLWAGFLLCTLLSQLTFMLSINKLYLIIL